MEALNDWTVNVGRYETGRPIVLPVPGWGGGHWVLGASSGGGKTMLVQQAIAKITVKFGRYVAFAVADPAWVHFGKFLPRLSTLAYGTEQALDLLVLAEAEMHRRLVAMYRHGIEKWSPDVRDKIGPYLILIVDELAAVTLAPKPPTPKRGEKREPSAEDRLIALAQQMRKTGGGLVLATQSPKVQVVSNLVLEQCPIRVCGKTKGPEQTKAILDTLDYPCHKADHPKGIPLHLPGVSYVDDGRHIRRGRCDGIRPEVFEAIGRDYAADRHDFGWPHEILPLGMAGATQVSDDELVFAAKEG